MQRIYDMIVSSETRTPTYILRSISKCNNKEQIVERLDDDRKLVKVWIETLQQVDFNIKNSFNELVLTPDGERYLKKFDSYR
jgi:hypothetical protein